MPLDTQFNSLYQAKAKPKLAPGVLLFSVEGRCYLANIYLGKDSKPQLLQPLEFNILSECRGEKSLESLAQAFGSSYEQVKGIVSKVSEASAMAIEFVENSDYDRWKLHAKTALRLLHEKRQEDTSLASAEILESYHHKIPNAGQQFESIETTVSHIFAEPSEALSGESFGQRLFLKLVDEGVTFSSILEVGAGTGFLTKAFLDTCQREKPEAYKSLKYTIVDLSPELARSQRELLADHLDRITFITADFLEYLRQGSAEKFDLVFANEMLGDLPLWKPGEESADLRSNYGINVVLKNLKRILKKNGLAYFSEHGLEGNPRRAVFLEGHTEYSLDIEVLTEEAERSGYTLVTENMGTWMGFCPLTEVIHDHSFACLARVVLPFLRESFGLAENSDSFAHRAYTRAGLEISLEAALAEMPLDRSISNICFLPLDSDDILSPFRFTSLKIRL